MKWERRSSRCNSRWEASGPGIHAKLPKEWPEARGKELEALTYSPCSPDPNRIKHLWDMPEQVRSTEATSRDPQGLKDPQPTTWCPRPVHLDGSRVSKDIHMNARTQCFTEEHWIVTRRSMLITRSPHLLSPFNVVADWCQSSSLLLFSFLLRMKHFISLVLKMLQKWSFISWLLSYIHT